MELAIWRATMRIVVLRREWKRLRIGRASLFDRRAQEGIKHHIDYATKEGFSVELLHHIVPHFKDELQVL